MEMSEHERKPAASMVSCKVKVENLNLNLNLNLNQEAVKMKKRRRDYDWTSIGVGVDPKKPLLSKDGTVLSTKRKNLSEAKRTPPKGPTPKKRGDIVDLIKSLSNAPPPAVGITSNRDASVSHDNSIRANIDQLICQSTPSNTISSTRQNDCIAEAKDVDSSGGASITYSLGNEKAVDIREKNSDLNVHGWKDRYYKGEGTIFI
eukprot:CAMPEP_0204637250 /NCGR_PEP_ID=MMETSP0717-20131115/35993_1 /ASSEMBLY_ACC=CAM_ASM_000666 /TAXON_ID=230516 /ORGANISM="Chaetoceros curvisetus" /LENGTH=203 /DNA_ID=CAMNT_0051656581 /DNA_START=126 /DNA_END=737 /DNA_ORIENTATION=-